MRRHFKGEKPDFDDEDDDFDEDDEMDGVDIEIQSSQFIEYDLVKADMKQKLLQQAMSFIQKSTPFWKFKKLETKLKSLEIVYERLCKLTNIDAIGVEDEEKTGD